MGVLLAMSIIFLNIIELKLCIVTLVFVMSKAVSNSDILFIDAVLLCWKYRHFSLIFASHGSVCSLPPKQVGLNALEGPLGKGQTE